MKDFACLLLSATSPKSASALPIPRCSYLNANAHTHTSLRAKVIALLPAASAGNQSFKTNKHTRTRRQTENNTQLSAALNEPASFFIITPLLPGSLQFSTLLWPRGTRRSEDQGIFISSNYIKPDERLEAKAAPVKEKKKKKALRYTHPAVSMWEGRVCGVKGEKW